MARLPASALLLVSVKIPNSPAMLRKLTLRVMSPAVGLVEVSVAVALSWAFSPIVSKGVVMVIFPAWPASLLSTINLVSVLRIRLSVALMVIFPALSSP